MVVPHAAIDGVVPVLQAVQTLEEILLQPGASAAVPWSAELAAKVSNQQQPVTREWLHAVGACMSACCRH